MPPSSSPKLYQLHTEPGSRSRQIISPLQIKGRDALNVYVGLVTFLSVIFPTCSFCPALSSPVHGPYLL